MESENAVATLEPSTENENSVTKPEKAKTKTWAKRLVKGLLRGSIYLLALLYVTHLIWLFSGSNQWEFAGEKNGSKVYTLKAPGSDFIQAKGVFRVHSTLAGIVALMQDPDISKDLGGYESRTIERVDDHLQYNYFREGSFFPYSPRDFLVRTLVYQSPDTKEVLIAYDAVPGKVPLNSCCVRVTHMHNTWRLTPLGNGEVEVEYTMDMNEGGFMPALLINFVHREVMYYLPDLQTLFSREKYQNAKIDFIKEK